MHEIPSEHTLRQWAYTDYVDAYNAYAEGMSPEEQLLLRQYTTQHNTLGKWMNKIAKTPSYSPYFQRGDGAEDYFDYPGPKFGDGINTPGTAKSRLHLQPLPPWKLMVEWGQQNGSPVPPYKPKVGETGKGEKGWVPYGWPTTAMSVGFSPTGGIPDVKKPDKTDDKTDTVADVLSRILWTKIHPDKPFPSIVKDDTKRKPWDQFQDPINDPYTKGTGISGPGGHEIQTRPTGDYFNGQLMDPNVPSPIGESVPYAQGNSYEQTTGLPAAAPYGYTESGVPRRFPGEEDGDTANLKGVSEFAPNKEFGPTINPYKQEPHINITRASGTDNGDAGMLQARPI